ncbi:unnamed protein product [Thelazia callipaeda]|uniref:RRM domain-containing protein n=1 Tax=Thelazia callipaeda TaxID=103827 RepID=A0A0N5CXY0_THECL|nr:unnamed protein product [Thelazia callipaeda]
MCAEVEKKRILLEGLNLKTSTNDIERFFTRWGPLSECIVLFDKKTSRSRGYGFICFVRNCHSEQCLETQPHTVDGVQIQMRLVKNTSSNPIAKYLRTRTILVSFLGAQLTISDIQNYFSSFGPNNVDYVVDRITEKTLYFAYVTFDESESTECCVNLKEHYINGHRIFIRKFIRQEDLKKAEQMERVKAIHEAQVAAELEEEIKRRRIYFNQKIYDDYAMKLALLHPPPPPSLPVQPSKNDDKNTKLSASTWVPLLPNNDFQHTASYLAGYGSRRESFKQNITFQESERLKHSGATASQWIPLPHKFHQTPLVGEYREQSEELNDKS